MSEWNQYRVGDICSAIYSGGTPSTSNEEYWDGDFYWLSSGETANRYISKTDKTITQKGIDNSSTKLAKSGTLVMACAGQGKTRGQASILKCDTYINQSIIAMVGKCESLDTTFLFYNMLLRYDELRMRSDASSTRGSITTDMLKKLPISVPDLPTQKRIADILSAYDDLIENNNCRIALLEKAAQELYKEWFVRFRFPGYENAKLENGLPEGWIYDRLCSIMSFGAGKERPSSGVVYPVYGGNGILDYCDSYNNENAIIIGRVGAYCGSVYYEPARCWISDNALYAISKNNAIYFNYYMLKHMNLNARQVGTGQPLITQGLLNKIKTIIPSNPLIMKYNSLVSDLLSQQHYLKRKNELLAKQRDLLLPRLMSGKLEV